MRKRRDEVQEDERLVLMLATALFKGSKPMARVWYSTPSATLFKCSPEECVVRGDGQDVIDWLEVRLGCKFIDV